MNSLSTFELYSGQGSWHGLIGSFSGATGAYSAISDESVKTDIQDIDLVDSQKILNLRPRKYKIRDSAEVYSGFVSQEVANVIPECVTVSGGLCLLNQTCLIPHFVKVIKVLESRVKVLEAIILGK